MVAMSQGELTLLLQALTMLLGVQHGPNNRST